MCKIASAFFLLLLPAVFGIPAKDELMVDLGDDTAVVESTVREARAVVPEHIEDLLQPGVKEAFLHTYGDKEDSDGNTQGYKKKTQDSGSDGYKHSDSYHKKDGDKYGYEIHSEYGQDKKAAIEAESKDGGHFEGYNHGDGAETKKLYQVVDNEKEGKKKLRAVEDYDGDSGYYADSGDSEGYSEAEVEADSENYEGDADTEGGEAESEYYEGDHEEGDANSGHYTAEAEDGDNESYTEYDEGDAEAEAEDDDY